MHQSSKELLPSDLLSLERYQAETKDFSIFLYKEVDSTNRVARDLVGKTEGGIIVVIADTQTSGRGRFSRHWFSPPGVNVYMSLIISKDRILFVPSLLNILSSLSVLESIVEMFKRANISLALKWPNDVLINEKKVSGILTERITNPESYIVGIGVNVNMRLDAFPFYLRDSATSTFLEFGKTINRAILISRILNRIMKNIELTNSDPNEIIERWIQWSSTIGSIVRINKGNEKFDALALGINHEGHLIVRCREGDLTISSAEVVHLR